jgi:hypothetical protein
VAKRGVSHEDIAKRLGLARSTVTKILNQLPTNRASGDTVRKVFETAREMGYDFQRLRTIHRRRSERKPVEMQVNIDILQNGSAVAATGSATLMDLSLNGAQIRDIQLSDGSGLPVSPFLVRVRFLTPPLQGVAGLAEVIRLTSRDEVRLGINFVELEPTDKTRLAEFLE